MINSTQGVAALHHVTDIFTDGSSIGGKSDVFIKIKYIYFEPGYFFMEPLKLLNHSIIVSDAQGIHHTAFDGHG